MTKTTRIRPPEHCVIKVRKFALESPVGTVLPCVVHEMRRREDGSAAFREVVVRVCIRSFDFPHALVKIARLDTKERLTVDLGWFWEALRVLRRRVHRKKLG